MILSIIFQKAALAVLKALTNLVPVTRCFVASFLSTGSDIRKRAFIPVTAVYIQEIYRIVAAVHA